MINKGDCVKQNRCNRNDFRYAYFSFLIVQILRNFIRQKLNVLTT